jgi:mono/diheme cytochrome c family protein
MKTVMLICIALLALADAKLSAAPAPAAERGAHLYRDLCQGCHMPEAQGAVGAGAYPSLAKNPRLVSWGYVAVTVLNGRHGMPAFGTRLDGRLDSSPQLSDAEIADVVNFLRTHFGNQFRDATNAARVATLPHPGGAVDQ